MNDFDTFLTKLYFLKFKISNREEELMKSNEADKHANIRNDQSIIEVRQQHIMVKELIAAYLQAQY